MSDALEPNETIKEAALEASYQNEADLIRSHPYKFLGAGADQLMDLGLWEPPGDMVLVRAITGKEISAVFSDGLLHAPEDGQYQVLENTVCYLIGATGPVVQATWLHRDDRAGDGDGPAQDMVWGPGLHYPAGSLEGVRKGRVVIHLASGADALSPEGQDGRWHMVRACFIGATLDPTVAREVVADSYTQTAREDQAAERARVAEANRRFV